MCLRYLETAFRCREVLVGRPRRGPESQGWNPSAGAPFLSCVHTLVTSMTSSRLPQRRACKFFGSRPPRRVMNFKNSMRLCSGSCLCSFGSSPNHAREQLPWFPQSHPAKSGVEGCEYITQPRLAQQIFPDSLCACEMLLYAHFAELVPTHNLGGCCRRIVWNRHFSDHHSLLVVLTP